MMSEASAPVMPATSKEAKATALWHMWCGPSTSGARGPDLYALLDAARDPVIYRKLRELAANEDIACLYQGAAAEELAAVGPYIVRLGPRKDVFDWLWDKGWGKSWGIFLWSAAGFGEVRAHFRKLTKVKTEEGQMLLFRFYDPRVLPIFLQTCTPAQIEEMFGPIMRFFVESRDGTALEEFTHIGGVLRRRLLPLGNRSSPGASI